MRHVLPVCFAFLMISIACYGAVNNNNVADDFLPLNVQELTLTDDGMALTFGFNEIIWSTGGTGENPVEVAEIYGGAMLEVEGEPSVPIAARMFRIPPRSGIRIEVLEADYETYTDMDYAISTGDHEGLNLVKDPHPSDDWYPAVVAQAGEPAIFGDFRVGSLAINPVQVNTALREVRVYNNIQVAIHFEGTDERNTIDHWPVAISEAKLPLYRLFLDWDESELDEYKLYRGGVQVVMRSSQQLMNLMEPWFEWKLQRGWELELLTDDDVQWNRTAIRAELINRYEDAETPFDYVVIIGDDQGTYSVQPGTGTGNYQGDESYALLAGGDLLADVGIGRISIQTDTQLRAYINKVLAYERDPNLNNTDWYLRGMVNVSDGHSGNSKMLMLRYARHAMLNIGYTQVDTTWRRGDTGNNFAIQKINDGVSLYSARGYISSGLDVNEIAGLDNDFMTPVVVDVTCYTGNWSNGLGISEAYMLSGSINSPTGGICGMGTATAGTRPDYNHVLSAGAYWAMLDLRMLTIGDMKLTSTYNGWNNYETVNNGGWRIWAQYFNLMGDPTVWTWTAIPEEITVTAEDQIELGMNNYDIIAEDEDENPIENAWVTFYKVDDDEEIIVRGVTDNEGYVSLDIQARYSGDAILTISKQNFAPNQVEVEVVSPNSRVGFSSINIVDNGNNGTEGNGNGIPEAGETVGLQIQAENFGNAQETNIEFTGSTDDDWVESVEGSVTIASLNAGQSTAGNGLILIEIASESQNDWILHIDLEAETDDDTYEDSYPVTVAAPQFAMTDIDVDGDMEPEETVDLRIELANVGGSDADDATGELISNEPFVRVTEAEADFDAMDIGDDDRGTFEILLHEAMIPGYFAHLSIVMTTESGQVDTVGITVQLGSKRSSDPCGPDGYGYYAFDNTDRGYNDIVPTFDWIEINPDANNNDFEGDELNLSDGIENQDESIVIDLPFSIQYYGEEFDELTVCTNGWVAMGSQEDMYHSRNWTIPAPDGPYYMIAAYWDDLRLTGNSGVFTYYDQPNGRFIVEWYNVTAGGQNNRFEIVFLSQQVRPTFSGDNDILFQFDDVGRSTNSMQYDVPYWTTGIENGRQDDGLLYYYYNRPAPGAVSSNNFDQGLAILFSTNVALITGTLEGTVSDLATGDPMEDILVYTPDTTYSAVTDAEGFYSFDEIPIGTWEFHIDIDCYNPISHGDIEIFEDETAEVDIALRHPEIELDPSVLDQDLQDVDEITVPVALINNGNGVLTYSATLFLQDPRENPDLLRNRNSNELDDLFSPWDFAASYELDPNETRHRGVVFVDRFFYVSGSNNFDPIGANKIYQYSRYDAELIATFDQPVPEDERSAQGIYGLAWDGEYMYGIDDDKMYQMEVRPTLGNNEGSIDLVDSWEIPVNDTRFLTFDPDNELFWTGEVNSNIYALNYEGEIVYEYEQDFSPRGVGWYPDDDAEFNLYFIGRAVADTLSRMIRMDPESGETELMFQYRTFDDGYVPIGADVSGSWHPLIWTFVTLQDGGPQDAIQSWVIEGNTSYFEISNPDGELEGDSETDIDLVFRGADLPIGEYPFFVGFENNACEEENNYIEVTMIIPDTTQAVEPKELEQPLEWAFKGVYPNPFNPLVNISFSLKGNVLVQARVYNLLGQQVANIVDHTFEAGHHSITFDGSDLASGMYFLQFEAGPIREMRKVILMK
ncbi:MAG: C25 family cysteine peptidase [Candidatus Electryonea clarkiae]|nr:C25 family cysteine peptidase [Candidatus Electryonea clarkiae]MDP8285345.1 C25 family cysteine peptidase [Candidatus Electryonea clarkiae]